MGASSVGDLCWHSGPFLVPLGAALFVICLAITPSAQDCVSRPRERGIVLLSGLSPLFQMVAYWGTGQGHRSCRLPQWLPSHAGVWSRVEVGDEGGRHAHPLLGSVDSVPCGSCTVHGICAWEAAGVSHRDLSCRWGECCRPIGKHVIAARGSEGCTQNSCTSIQRLR